LALGNLGNLGETASAQAIEAAGRQAAEGNFIRSIFYAAG